MESSDFTALYGQETYDKYFDNTLAEPEYYGTVNVGTHSKFSIWM